MRDLPADEELSRCVNRRGVTGPSTIVVLDSARRVGTMTDLSHIRHRGLATR